MVLALELAGWQVPVLLAERHRRPSSFPRGRAISTRSMEILPCLNVNILIEADLGLLLRDRFSLVYAISNAEVHATVLTVDNERRWLVNVMLPDDAWVDPTPTWCARMVRAAVDREDLAFRVVSRAPWQAAAGLVRHYRQGRLVITGDAMHAVSGGPPRGVPHR